MHRTIQTTPDFVSGIVNRPVNREHVYDVVADLIARQPDHLAELVTLMTAINNAGVDLVEHWDCLTAELVLGEMERISNK